MFLHENRWTIRRYHFRLVIRRSDSRCCYRLKLPLRDMHGYQAIFPSLCYPRLFHRRNFVEFLSKKVCVLSWKESCCGFQLLNPNILAETKFYQTINEDNLTWSKMERFKIRKTVRIFFPIWYVSFRISSFPIESNIFIKIFITRFRKQPRRGVIEQFTLSSSHHHPIIGRLTL